MQWPEERWQSAEKTQGQRIRIPWLEPWCDEAETLSPNPLGLLGLVWGGTLHFYNSLGRLYQCRLGWHAPALKYIEQLTGPVRKVFWSSILSTGCTANKSAELCLNYSALPFWNSLAERRSRGHTFYIHHARLVDGPDRSLWCKDPRSW